MYLQEDMPTGKVQRSHSTTAAPILFVCKKDESHKLGIDYRALKRLMIPNKYPLPLMSELLDKKSGGKSFIRLNLKNRY